MDSENNVRRNIAIRLNILSRLMRSDFDKRINDINVTRSQWALIAVVSRQPGATQRAIAERLEVSEASAGRLIDKLCAEGLLERRERDEDRRARAVYLTDAAEPLLAKLGIIAKPTVTKMFAGFEVSDLLAVPGFLALIYHNVSEV